jgi:hypothetical protein
LSELRIDWACPKCGAKPSEHGKGGETKCRDRYCEGFICECDGDQADAHGELLSDVCEQANCHHCGWGGKFPRPPRSALPWEKKALAAGWSPPDGWSVKP